MTLSSLDRRAHRLSRANGVRRTLAVGLVSVMTVAACSNPRPEGKPIDGSLGPKACGDFYVKILDLFDVDIPDPGWSWVRNAKPSAPIFRDVTGEVTYSDVTASDFPASHQSHDMNIDIKVDNPQQDILSNTGLPNDEDDVGKKKDLKKPTTLETEWEIGTSPNERGRNVNEKYFPRWAWPSVGDRVWENGHWIFDCGHPKGVAGVGHLKTEIHPIRAIASIRQQVKVLAASRTIPIPVTVADVYIHGEAGFATDILNCGQDLLLNNIVTRCNTRTTPIAETFSFVMDLPPKRTNASKLIVQVDNAPDNTVSTPPIVEQIAGPKVRVTIPLANSGIKPTDYYGRTISVGWDEAPPEGIVPLEVNIEKMTLHEDKEPSISDCECTFFWANVNRAPKAWIRLADFARGNMNDYDDDHGSGDGEMVFVGAKFNFYLLAGKSFTLRANGYDQDCLDDEYGFLAFSQSAAACKFQDWDNDGLAHLKYTFDPPFTAFQRRIVKAGSDYDLLVSIRRTDLPQPTHTEEPNCGPIAC